MKNQTYNGWANYATWRINLEIFDGADFTGYSNDEYELSQQLRDYAEEVIFIDIPDGLAKDYAYAFLQEVRWTQIAKSIIANEEENDDFGGWNNREEQIINQNLLGHKNPPANWGDK